MKTVKFIIENYKSDSIDGRDLHRLMNFIPEKDLKALGLILKDGHVGKHKHIALTKRNVLTQLKKDVEFGFEKALNQRGISSSLMAYTVQMWNWILEEGLEDFDRYAQYGLPIFKATAVKYGFNNPIGDDTGSESKYACY